MVNKQNRNRHKNFTRKQLLKILEIPKLIRQLRIRFLVKCPFHHFSTTNRINTIFETFKTIKIRQSSIEGFDSKFRHAPSEFTLDPNPRRFESWRLFSVLCEFSRWQDERDDPPGSWPCAES